MDANRESYWRHRLLKGELAAVDSYEHALRDVEDHPSRGTTPRKPVSVRIGRRVPGERSRGRWRPRRPGSTTPPRSRGAATGRPRIFWGHGTRDPNIPFALAERGRRRLEEAGAVLVARDYEIGHWIAPEKIEDAMRFVEGKGEDRGES